MLRPKPRPIRRGASGARAWTIAQELRARRGWLLDDAFFQRSWSAHLGTTAFETSAYVSLFFDGPGMVVAITQSFPKAVPPANADDAVQHLRASLGERYWVSPLGDSLVTKVVSDKPKRLLAEIAHVERVLGGRAANRFGRSPRSQIGRRWHVVEALRASSWQLGTLSFSRRLGDKLHQLWASIGVHVDSADGRPGISANFAGWVPKKSKRWTQFRNDTAVDLRAAGFRINEEKPRSFQAGRWVAGLSGTRALNQADVFDELLDSGADVVGRLD